MCHLPVRVNAGIGATGTHHFKVSPEEMPQHALHLCLHSAQAQMLRLPSPPVEVTPVVRDLQT